MLVAYLAALLIAAPAELPHLPGWHSGAARVASGCKRCVQTASWASTIGYRDAPNNFPHTTVAALGSDDVIIQISRSCEPSPPRWIYTRRPLQIIRSQIHTSFEGNTTRGRVSQWLTATWRSGSYVSVYVYFGSPSPSAATVGRAQREPDGTRFTTWTSRR